MYVGHRFTMETTNCPEQVARFLLDGTTLPPALQLPNGQHVEQLRFRGRYLTVYTKNRTNTFSGRREGRLPLCLDLDALATAAAAQKRPAPADTPSDPTPAAKAPRGKKAKESRPQTMPPPPTSPSSVPHVHS